MIDYKGDPDFWKNAGYDERTWEKHKKDVEEAERLIIAKFPQLKGCIKNGLGATTSERLKFKPEEKHENDIMIHQNYERICDVEVTGSDKIIPSATRPLWILQGKYDYAKKSGIPTWFWMPYPRAGRVYMVPFRLVAKHEDNLTTVHIKTDPKTGRKIPETYIEVPFNEALTVEDFFVEFGKMLK